MVSTFCQKLDIISQVRVYYSRSRRPSVHRLHKHMNQDNIRVSVETPDGRAVRVYGHDGRSYIESREDMVYRIRVKNQTANRIKAVISVDGISIISGKPVTDSKEETGYILQPYAEELFKGYRVDDNQVAEFKFVKREASYATEKGEGANNGVIAVRAYAEKESQADKRLKEMQEQIDALKNRPRDKEYIPYPVYPVRPYRPWRPYWEDTYADWGYRPSIWMCAVGQSSDTVTSSTVSNCSFQSTQTTMNCSSEMTELRAMAASESTQLDSNPFAHGSSWGAALQEKVTHVAFEVGKLIAEVSFFYAPLEGLKALGVNVTREKQVVFPQAFKAGYCAPPKGWHSGQAT